MYIKSIVIDGFKSYANRTCVEPFDPSFNAITGLNGSGKSNILDSICFVLGINNLTHIRVNNLQDLIYKRGQTGISKATVTIVFDNTNKQQSPPGMHSYDEISVARQILLGGKNKYFMNGSIVPVKRIQDFFGSVQLNVNNPHFLVMQGKITKVLNMKPPEILEMIEEAAGCKIYETKRQQYQRSMEKNDTQLAAITDTITNVIEPKLNKLKEQRQAFSEYENIEEEVNRLSKVYCAWCYYNIEKLMESREREVIEIENEIQRKENLITENSVKAEDIEKEFNLKMEQNKMEIKNKLEELEAIVKTKQKSAAKSVATEKSVRDEINEEKTQIDRHKKNIKDCERLLEGKKQTLAKSQEVFDKLKSTQDADQAALELCEKKYQALRAGKEVTETGDVQSLKLQLTDAKQQATESETNKTIYSEDLKLKRQKLETLQSSMGPAASDYKKDQADLASYEEQENTLKAKIQELNFSEENMLALERKTYDLKLAIENVEDKIGTFFSHYPLARFKYNDPEPNFDRSSILGVVCDLFKLKDRTYSRAIETVAKGRLFNVVVDNESTGKKLLQKGNLKHRTTFIPLNKIVGSTLHKDVVRVAQKLVGNENVIPALQVLEYDKRLQPVMEYIFGDVFITKNLNTARKITFDKTVRKKCVTLDGDITDPSGVLTGGAEISTPPILTLLEDIKAEEKKHREMNSNLVNLQNQLRTMSSVQEKYLILQSNLDTVVYNHRFLSDRIKLGTYYQQQEEVKSLQNSIADLEQKLKECAAKQADSARKINEIELKMKNPESFLARQKQETSEQLSKLKKQAENSKKEWELREQEYEILTMEIDELRTSIATAQDQIKASETLLEELRVKCDKAADAARETKDELADAESQLKSERQAFAEKSKGVQQLMKAKDKLLQENTDMELELKKLKHDLADARTEHKAAKGEHGRRAKDIKNLNKNTLVDAKNLSDADARDMQNLLASKKNTLSELSKMINPKAQKMYQAEEKQYQLLKNRYEEIRDDRDCIARSIQNLDKQKMEIMQVAFKQISNDIGSILRMLLPKADARLAIPKGHTLLTGVQIQVSLGDVWKESLGELSGGQRSLVALAFILAMLRFNPAPVYILDEVDAALDMSHTENIGAMLKHHFKKSQFIVVSLKNGMFDNANVLFKTQFIEGKSMIERISNVR